VLVRILDEVLLAGAAGLRRVPSPLIEFQSAVPEHRIKDMALRDFVYHIFRFVEIFIEGARKGAVRQDPLHPLFLAEGPQFTSVAMLAGYADEVVEQFRAWSEETHDWQQEVDGAFYGIVPLERLFEEVLQHSSHHLRQFVVLGEEMGMLPVSVPASLASVALPASFW
jgi:hypothetical protein